jgi:hypothetical protein
MSRSVASQLTACQDYRPHVIELWPAGYVLYRAGPIDNVRQCSTINEAGDGLPIYDSHTKSEPS